MREFLNKHGSIVAACVLFIAAAIWFLFLRAPSAPNLSKAFFVDEDTGEEQVLSLEEYPPRTNPKSGKPTLVQAIKYSCDGRKTIHTAYYLKFTEGTKAALEKAFKATGKPAGIDVSNSSWVRSPDKNAKWLPAGSPDGLAITHIECPSGGDIEIILPP